MEYKGYEVIKTNDERLAHFYEVKDNIFNLLENQYLLVEDETGKVVDSYVWQNESFRKVLYTKFDNYFTGLVKPRNAQQEILFDMLADKQTTIKLATGGFGTGKAQPNSTLIPTPKGYKSLGELQIGDYVFDRFGKPTKILGVYPQGKIDAYRITFSDGRQSICNNEHIWSCLTSKGNLKEFTVSEMLSRGLQKSNGSYRFIIPNCKPVQYTEKKYNIDPYVIGVLLGDGCCLEENLTISSQDKEIIQNVAKLIGAIDYIKCSENNFSWNFVLNKETKFFRTKIYLRDLEGIQEYSYNKFIPEQYKYGSIEQRYALLQGLMDTDGTISKEKGRIRFTSTSLRLIKDVIEVCNSLGLSASYNEDFRDKYTNGVCYNLFISCIPQDKHLLFRLSRKKKIALSLSITKYARNNNLTIRHIEKLSEQEDMTCIYVDNPEHLYLTNNYIVTHNTMSLVIAALDALTKGKYDKIIWVRNNIEVKDTIPLGALPGDSYDKLLPFAMPLADHCGGLEGLQQLIEQNKIEIVHLGFLRGRDIKNSIILCSEAENLTKQHIQLLIGRVGEGSTLWLDGDLKQRDKFTFEKSAGLEIMIERLKGNKLFGYVKLLKTERSETARLADLLDD